MYLFLLLFKAARSDSDGVEYSGDGKILLSTPTTLTSYTVPAACDTIQGGDSRIKSSFYNCIDNIKSLKFAPGSNLIRIDTYVFQESSIESVDFSECSYLRELNSSVFRLCSKLSNVILPEGLERIKSGCFRKCNSLVTIKIPDTVKYIEGYHETHGAALYSCEKLEEIIFSENSQLIEMGADNCIGCVSMCRIYLPKNANINTGTSLFGGKISNITLNSENKNFVLKDGFLLNSTGTEIYYALYTTADEVFVPDYITKLRNSAFRYNSMKKVSFKGAINYIDSFAFDSCKELLSFKYPAGPLTHIWQRTFSYSDKLERVELSPSITYIGSKAFKKCYSLKFININDDITDIKECAFFMCTSLTSFKIPNKIQNLDFGFISGCPITNLDLNGNSLITEDDQKIVYKGTEALYFYGTKPDITIKAECTDISSYAFFQKKIRSINILSNTRLSIFTSAFEETILEEITLPKCTEIISEAAFKNISTLRRVVISSESTITKIPISCFSHCYNLASVSIPNGIITIEDYAFSSCTLLAGIKFENLALLQTIGKQAFNYTSISSLTLPSSIKSIDNNCFEGCKLISVEMSSCTEFTNIIQGAFYNCPSLSTVHFSDNTQYIKGLSFALCTSLTEILLPVNIIEVSPRAFENCFKLRKLSLPGSCKLESICGQTFKGCKSLCELYVPENDPNFCGIDGVLMNNKKTLLKLFLPGSPLTMFVIPATVTEIGNYAFQDCANLKTIVIPEGQITSVGFRSFDGCTSLSALWLPSSLSKFGTDAFINCPNLKCGSVVYLHGNIVNAIKAGIPEIAFETNCKPIKISHCKCVPFTISFNALLLVLTIL